MSAFDTCGAQVGNADGGRMHMKASMALQPNVPAARSLALLAPTRDAAHAAYMHAWAIWANLDGEIDPNKAQLGADLSGEIAAWLMGNARWDDLGDFLATLKSGGAATAAYLQKDRALHAQAALAVQRGDYTSALPILRGHCFPTYGNLRSELITLWHTAQEQKAVAHKGGVPLTIPERLAMRKRLWCDGDHTGGTLHSKCVVGPPNLGYAY